MRFDWEVSFLHFSSQQSLCLAKTLNWDKYSVLPCPADVLIFRLRHLKTCPLQMCCPGYRQLSTYLPLYTPPELYPCFWYLWTQFFVIYWRYVCLVWPPYYTRQDWVKLLFHERLLDMNWKYRDMHNIPLPIDLEFRETFSNKQRLTGLLSRIYIYDLSSIQ